tara:strand:+ start:3200 stop:3424 length:225 start_codon:yes stop_codon:yes gene_type:complete
MRIATILSDGNWKTIDEMKSVFLKNGWSFHNASQIAQLCRMTNGIQLRKVGIKSHLQYRMESRPAFERFMGIEV